MASQGTNEPILDIWGEAETDVSGIIPSPGKPGACARSYTDILSPSRHVLSSSLLTRREVSNDTWLKVLERVCWKSNPRQP